MLLEASLAIMEEALKNPERLNKSSYLFANDPNTVKTIFILGPSHHVRLSACALTQCSTYQTPLGDLTINREINQQLLDTGG